LQSCFWAHPEQVSFVAIVQTAIKRIVYSPNRG
jgi:hypothetical protein